MPVAGSSEQRTEGRVDPHGGTRQYGTDGALPGWSGDDSPDPWDFCGPIPGRRRAH